MKSPMTALLTLRATLSIALLGLLAACADPAALPLASTDAESAVHALSGARALNGSFAVSSITIETRYWDATGPLPTSATAAATFNGLSTTTPTGYTNAPVAVSGLVRTVVSVGTDPDTGLPDTTFAAIRNPGGAWNNVATRYRILLTPSVTTLAAFQFGVDFKGGALFVDGAMQAENWNDPSWFGYWQMDTSSTIVPSYGDSDALLQATVSLAAGVQHTIEVIGFEDGNDFPGTAARFNVGNGWQYLTGPAQTRTLTVTKSGSATGSVASVVPAGTPAGTPRIVCGVTCAAPFAWNSNVTLTAAPANPTVQFVGWTGGCVGTGTTCTVQMDVARTVNAEFRQVYSGTVTVGSITVETRYWDQSKFVPSAVPSVLTSFNSLANTVAGHTNVPVPVASLSNNAALFAPPNVGAYQNIATRSIHTMNSVGSSEVSWRVDGDYGKGAVLIVDGTVLVTAWSGVGPGVWSLNGKTVLTAGQHTITIVGFEDCCDGGSPTVEFNTNGGSFGTVATAPPPNVTLTVARAGSGAGQVSSAPAGISCGPICTKSVVAGSQLTLTATADPLSYFTGWSGGGCTGTGTCVVRVLTAQTVTATFVKNVLTVVRAGTGAGTVTSGPAGIACGTACTAPFAVGEAVTLTAAPDPTSVFGGWTGAAGCTTSTTCVVPLNAAQSVTATFTRLTVPLTVAAAGTGTGTITSSPAGIACGATCSAPFAMGSIVTLSATPSSTATFGGWSVTGCTGTTCAVTMGVAQTVTATFTKKTDVTPPLLSCVATPSRLWPANHKMVDIRIAVSFTDAGSGTGAFTLLSVTSSEPDDAKESSGKDDDKKGSDGKKGNDDKKGGDDDDHDDDDKGDGNTVNDIQGWLVGSADILGQLRAERSGNGPGRVYTLTYRGTDLAGNATTSSCKVTVPHDNR